MRKIAIIGLGYVGLPVAVAFARSGKSVIGFDVKIDRVRELRAGVDKTGETDESDLKHPTLTFTTDPMEIRGADFFIVTVPTPIDSAHQPDLQALLEASTTVGQALKLGDIVVYESTVYPGATEEDCIPVLERASSLRAGTEFNVGYSPERINPGDRDHRFETIKKIVSAQNDRTLDIIAELYGSVVKAGIHKAASIKVAEAAKVIENTQRDLNIALMNELSSICHLLNIDTIDVLSAAQTKWNFLPFVPGLVGGHCIGVDPYYLTHRAEKAGYHPEVILAGRRINDGVGQQVARECIKRLLRNGSSSRQIIIFGLTFKENVPDIRNSKVVDIFRELTSFGASVQVHDPLASKQDAFREYGIKLAEFDELQPAGAVILAVPHEPYLSSGWPLIASLLKDSKGIVLDLKSRLDRAKIPPGIELWRL
jgi:UDP-N-acetyl-D-glucosamine/UDP-N-acetyl-D-galactosamine dehydrogenase